MISERLCVYARRQPRRFTYEGLGGGGRCRGLLVSENGHEGDVLQCLGELVT